MNATAFTSLFALIAGGVLIALFMRLRAVGESHKLKLHRSKQAGLADLLKHASIVDDGVILGKDGSLMAAWFYRGNDNASATEREREYNSAQINKAIIRLGNGWACHVDAVRVKAPQYSHPNDSHFPDPVSAAIDEERRRFFETNGKVFEGAFVATVTWFPPVLAERKLVELMYSDEAEKPDAQGVADELLAEFKQAVAGIESRLSSALKLERLGAQKVLNEDGTTTVFDQFLQWIHFCVTGVNHPIALPANPMYIDSLIGGKELYTGVIPKIGRNFVQVVSIDGFPSASHPGILTALGEIPAQYRWSSRFIFLDQHVANSHLEKFKKRWRQRVRGFVTALVNPNSPDVDEDAVNMVADAAAAIAETNSKMVAQGYYTSVVVIMDENRDVVEAAALLVERSINELGFTARIETVNAMDAFIGSVPGHVVENVRRPIINTMNLADMLPTSSIWTGDERAPCPLFPPNAPALMHALTAGNAPFRVNMHVGDLGHAAMFGPTRAGKSTHVGMLALQYLRYEGARVYVFEKGMSFYIACKAVGGVHYNIGDEKQRTAYAPLKDLRSRSRRAWAMQWMATIMELNNVQMTPELSNEIATAVMTMARSASGGGSLTTFRTLVQSAEVRAVLQQYTVDGVMGHLLDGQEDGFSIDEVSTMCFELEQLMHMGDKYALPVLLYMFRRIEESLDGRPTFIILDEAWLMLGNPAFRAKLREWLKAFAKKNCHILLATQSLSDAKESGILDVIVESTATKIFLANPAANDEEFSATYTQMGLNRRQIEIIQAATKKKDYYLTSEKGRRLYQLALGPLALAFVGATDPESIAEVQRLEEKHGGRRFASDLSEGWVNEWLAGRNINLNDYGVAA
ncbi:conjugal transfer protein TrbE [Pandoraea apista]|uniref:VirB4 family type IV secretion/conjugal transfer ATPase n=1 Tax=Pandoraea apista TaxID=93218 RepID=UPI000659F16B|nr:conjugal transfer protein TrbE [Pandoraea apista]CFB60430.1 Type IV secretion system protein virB4 [Pandoraea apista]